MLERGSAWKGHKDSVPRVLDHVFASLCGERSRISLLRGWQVSSLLIILHNHHFLAWVSCRVASPSLVSLRATRAFPALNSSSYSMNAKFLGANRTSLSYDTLTKVLGKWWRFLWAFGLWLPGWVPGRRGCGWVDLRPILSYPYVLLLFKDVFFPLNAHALLLGAGHELLDILLSVVILRAVSELEGPFKFGNYIWLLPSETHSLAETSLTMVLP